MATHISDFLSQSDVFIDVRASNKMQLLTDLCRRAAASINADAKGISAEILKREALGSTGVGGGIAVPHARIKSVTRTFGLLARLKDAIEFDAMDQIPVDIVCLLLLPATPKGQQLNSLALVSRKLRDTNIAANVRRAVNPSDLYSAIGSDSPRPRIAIV